MVPLAEREKRPCGDSLALLKEAKSALACGGRMRYARLGGKEARAHV